MIKNTQDWIPAPEILNEALALCIWRAPGLGTVMQFKPSVVSALLAWLTQPSGQVCRAFLTFTCALSHFSCVQVFAILWTAALQTPQSMGFSRQEHWRGLPFPSPGDLPNPGIELTSLLPPALAGGFFTVVPTWEALASQQELILWTN